MKVWLVTVGEPLPTDPGAPRLLRAGVLANYLIAAGHEVLWWTSSFDHTHKTQRKSREKRVRLSSGLEIHLLHGPGYRRNISFARIRDHRALAREFATLARMEKLPDVVLTSFPPIELAYEAARFGRDKGVPVILDVRDLWPDIFLYAVPRQLRGIARVASLPAMRMTSRAFAMASAVTGISPPMVSWGLMKAQRRETAMDRDFPMGYPSPQPDAQSTAQGRDWWRATHGITKDSRFTVVFFGSIGSTVDFAPVIAAARELGSSRVRFVICGTGETLEAVRANARGVENVILPGWVDAARIAALLEIGDCGLAPFRQRADYLTSYPNKVLEYLSGGLPVLSSVGGLIGELLEKEKCGFVYGPAGPSLGEAVTRLQENPDALRSMSSNAAKVFFSRFSAEHVYPQMIDYLSNAVDTFGNNPTVA